MPAKIDRAAWLGKLRGHVSDSRARFEADRREREAAGKLPPDQNIILTEREVRGEWDASRVLMTTLGGAVRPITANDLAAFRQNMRMAQKAFNPRGGQGITARQVIDLASGKPLIYTNAYDLKQGYQSDIDKARSEITMCVPASAMNDTVRFITNAGPNSSVNRHYVTVKFMRWDEACAKVAALEKGDTAGVRRIANWLRKQKLAFDCDCERHRYFFRYVASIGGFAAGRKETGYPKIRNPHLNGCACKHVLRVMADIESSGAVLRFLEKHLSKVSEYKARTQLTQKQAEEQLSGKRRPTPIKTSDMRAQEAAKRREARAAKKVGKTPTPGKKPAAQTRQAQATQKAAAELAKKFGLTPDQVLKILAAQAQAQG